MEEDEKPEEIDVTNLKSTDARNGFYSVLPTALEIAKDKGQLRVEWTPPEDTLCDSYKLNYTVLSLSKPKNFEVSTTNYYAHIKFLTGHKLEVRYGNDA